MNDADAEAQKARVMALWDAWGVPLGLATWRRVTHEWDRGEIEDNDGAMMVADSDWRYRHATIRVNLVRVKAEDDDTLVWAYVHELMHLFLSGLLEAHIQRVDRDAFRIIEEHTCTTLAQGIVWLATIVGDRRPPATPETVAAEYEGSHVEPVGTPDV